MYCFLFAVLSLACVNSLPFHHGNHVNFYPEEHVYPEIPHMATEKPRHNFHAKGKGFVLNLNFAGGSSNGENEEKKPFNEFDNEKIKSVVRHILKTFKVAKLFHMEEEEMKKMVNVMLEGFKRHVVEEVVKQVKESFMKDKAELMKKIMEGKEAVKMMIGTEKSAVLKMIAEAKMELKEILAGKIIGKVGWQTTETTTTMLPITTTTTTPF